MPATIGHEAGKLFAETLDLGAFQAKEYSVLRVRFRQAWDPADPTSLAWGVVVAFLEAEWRGLNISHWREACGAIADLIDAEADKLEVDGGADDADNWIKVSEAQRISGVNKGVISRAADAGEIKTNGKSRRDRRLDAGSFSQWIVKRSPGAESTPDPQTVVERAKAERRKRGVSGDD
jgi:hypothetical protein